MKVKLPIIGQIKTGKDIEPEIKIVEKATSELLGGVLYNTTGKLSDEKTVSKKVLEANKGWVYRNNDVIAKEVSTVEFELYRIDLKNGEIVYNKIDDHPLLELLDKFNDVTTKSDALYNTQSHKKLTGDAFWLLEGPLNAPTNVFVLPPDKIELKLGDPTKGIASLIEGYTYKDTIDGKTVEREYKKDELLHFKTPNPSNMFRGYGVVEAIAETIDLDNITTDVTRKFFDNGAITNFVLSTEGKLNDEQLKRLKAELKAAYTGRNNAYNTMILGGGLKPENITMSNREMEFLKQLEWYRDKIMVAFGNTKASLGLTDDVNRASHESSLISWKRSTIKPDMEAIVNTINEFLVPKYGERLVLGFADPVPEDRASKIVEIEKAKSILSVNERRGLLGYDDIPDGDVIPELESNRRADEMLNTPPALKNVNLNRMLRKYGIATMQKEYQKLKKEALPLAKQIVKSKKKKVEPIITSEHTQFSNQKIWEYWEKQIRIVEVMEKRFDNITKQFIDSIEKQVLGNLESEITGKTKALVDEDELIVQAGVDFRPVLMEMATISGQQAMALINEEDPYIPVKIRPKIDRNIDRFAGSMVDTDKKIMGNIIENGIKEGLSVPQIRSQIEDKFDELRRYQAERVTRTEVLRVSNEAAVDAWEQSGVVEGKQWLTAEDDRVDEECAELNGKIINLEGTYIKQEYGDVEEPPIHPNCRCVVLPVLEKVKGYMPATIFEKEILEKKMEGLEAKIDKRTKEYKTLKAKNLEQDKFIQELEGLIDGSPEDN